MAEDGTNADVLRGHRERLKRRHVELVQRTFADVSRDPELAAEYFYGELFRRAPETRAMFAEDMSVQRSTFMEALEAAVRGIEDADALFAQVSDLGRRHVEFGVREDHYAEVGAALIWALEQGLGDGFTDETREAWTRVYALIAEVMIMSGAQRGVPGGAAEARVGWTSRAAN